MVEVLIFPDEKTLVLLGSLVHFTSQVTGFTDPEYQWYVDKELVEGETSDTFDFTPESIGAYAVSLKVKSAVNGDETESETTIVIAQDESILDKLDAIETALGLLGTSEQLTTIEGKLDDVKTALGLLGTNATLEDIKTALATVKESLQHIKKAT